MNPYLKNYRYQKNTQNKSSLKSKSIDELLIRTSTESTKFSKSPYNYCVIIYSLIYLYLFT